MERQQLRLTMERNKTAKTKMGCDIAAHEWLASCDTLDPVLSSRGDIRPSESFTLPAMQGRTILRPDDLSPKEFLGLISAAKSLECLKARHCEPRMLVDKHIALVFETDSTRTRSAVERAAHDQGASVTYFGPVGSHLGKQESVADTARVLGRYYDGIVYRGPRQQRAEDFA